MDRGTGQFSGIYQELADLLGEAAVRQIWKQYGGSTVTFPMRLYSRESVRRYIAEHREGMRPAEIGRRVGLSERRVRQILRELQGSSPAAAGKELDQKEER